MRSTSILAAAGLLLAPVVAQAQYELSNEFLRVTAADDGRWAIYTTGGVDGDPVGGNDNDNAEKLLALL